MDYGILPFMNLPDLKNKSAGQQLELLTQKFKKAPSDKIEKYMKDSKAKMDFMKKQSLIHEEKKDLKILAEQAAFSYLIAQLAENNLPVRSNKERGQLGGRGHKGGVTNTPALSNRLKAQRKHLKFIKTKAKKEDINQGKALKLVFKEFIKEVDQIPSDLLLYRWNTKGMHGFLEDDKYYTPPKIIETARFVMGSIDLDPASDEEAQKIVKAKKFFTKTDDSLRRPWIGNVWLNPPFILGLMKDFVSALEHGLASGNTKQAIVITNYKTETKWAQRLLDMSNALCFHKGRIAFMRSSTEQLKRGGKYGQIIYGFSVKEDRFKLGFEKLGKCIIKNDNKNPYNRHNWKWPKLSKK